jgi:hypothetical protein
MRKVAYAMRKLRQWMGGWEDRASYWADNMAKCSCHGCTAPRKREDRRRNHMQTYLQELNDA